MASPMERDFDVHFKSQCDVSDFDVDLSKFRSKSMMENMLKLLGSYKLTVNTHRAGGPLPLLSVF
jgi:hypothetical protein